MPHDLVSKAVRGAELKQDTAEVQKNKMADAYRNHPYLLESTITPHSPETKEVLSRLNVRRSMKDVKGKMKAPVSEVTVGERHEMRQRIKSISLFPNIYNRSMIFAAKGPD